MGVRVSTWVYCISAELGSVTVASHEPQMPGDLRHSDTFFRSGGPVTRADDVAADLGCLRFLPDDALDGIEVVVVAQELGDAEVLHVGDDHRVFDVERW